MLGCWEFRSLCTDLVVFVCSESGLGAGCSLWCTDLHMFLWVVWGSLTCSESGLGASVTMLGVPCIQIFICFCGLCGHESGLGCWVVRSPCTDLVVFVASESGLGAGCSLWCTDLHLFLWVVWS
jgi:hypothetical protein